MPLSNEVKLKHKSEKLYGVVSADGLRITDESGEHLGTVVDRTQLPLPGKGSWLYGGNYWSYTVMAADRLWWGKGCPSKPIKLYPKTYRYSRGN